MIRPRWYEWLAFALLAHFVLACFGVPPLWAPLGSGAEGWLRTVGLIVLHMAAGFVVLGYVMRHDDDPRFRAGGRL